MQSRNIHTNIVKKCVDAKKGRSGGMNWEIGMDIYTILGEGDGTPLPVVLLPGKIPWTEGPGRL